MPPLPQAAQTIAEEQQEKEGGIVGIEDYAVSFEIKGRNIVFKKAGKAFAVSLRELFRTLNTAELAKKLGLPAKEMLELKERIREEIVSKPLRDVISFARVSCLYTKPKNPLILGKELIELEKEWALYEAYQAVSYTHLTLPTN